MREPLVPCRKGDLLTETAPPKKDRRSLLTVTATYVGMVLAFFAPKFSSLWGLATAPSATADVPTLVSLPPRQHSYLVEQGWIMGISVLDLLGLSLCSAAVTLIGSSVSQPSGN